MEHRLARNGVTVAMIEWDRLASSLSKLKMTGWKPIPLLQSDIHFANDPYQMIRMAKYILGGTAEQDSCNATLALRPKYDQVRVVLFGKASDLRANMIGRDHPRGCSDSL